MSELLFPQKRVCRVGMEDSVKEQIGPGELVLQELGCQQL